MPVTKSPRRWIALVAVGAVIALGACDEEADPSSNEPPMPTPTPTPTVLSEEAEVIVQNRSFQPATISVTEGTEITWSSEDQNVPHTVTSGEPGDRQELFDGELENAGTNYSVRFGMEGEYPYFCRIHPSMRGTVVVEP